jgi:hypothetical protein
VVGLAYKSKIVYIQLTFNLILLFTIFIGMRILFSIIFNNINKRDINFNINNERICVLFISF